MKSFKRLFCVFDDPESRDYVLCKVLHSFLYFVVNVQSFPRRVSRYPFHIVFFIFSVLSPFFLQSFTRKEKQVLLLFFCYQGHNFFTTFLLFLNLYVLFCLSVLSLLHCLGFIDPELTADCSNQFPKLHQANNLFLLLQMHLPKFLLFFSLH